MLKDTRDGDQAYWCHTCNRGWRAGHLPPEARRAKAKALLEAALEIEPEVISVPEVVVLEPEVKIKAARVAKIKAPEVMLEPEIKAKRATKKLVLEVAAPPEPKIMPPPIVLPVPKRQAKPRQKTPLLLGQTEVQQNLFSS